MDVGVSERMPGPGPGGVGGSAGGDPRQAAAAAPDASLAGTPLRRPLSGMASAENDASEQNNVSLSDLARRIRAPRQAEIRVSEDGGLTKTRSGEVLSFSTGRAASLPKVLTSFGVTQTTWRASRIPLADPAPGWLGLPLTFVPLLLFAALMVFAWRSITSADTCRSACHCGSRSSNAVSNRAKRFEHIPSVAAQHARSVLSGG
ncbi:MAG: hypothetical protein ACR2IK_18960 [Chloroflexota bacterium]